MVKEMLKPKDKRASTIKKVKSTKTKSKINDTPKDQKTKKTVKAKK